MSSILIIDDNSDFLATFAVLVRFLGHQVFTSLASIESDKILKKNPIDLIFIDVLLPGSRESGFDLAKKYREKYPNSASVLLTEKPQVFHTCEENIEDYVDDSICKLFPPDFSLETLEKIIEGAIQKRQDINFELEYRKAFGDLFPHLNFIKFMNRAVHGGKSGEIERIEGITTDGPPIPLVWTVYSVRKYKNRVVLCLASTDGCGLECKFCGSKRKKLWGLLSADEIVAQALHGLMSYQTRSIFEGDKEKIIDVNFTAQGDSVFNNLDNCCKAVEMLSGLAIGNRKLINSFIFTTVGHIKNLKRFLREYPDLPVKFYWSLNFPRQSQRDEFMPGTKAHPIKSLCEVFEQIALAGKEVTASIILVNGINDTDEDIERLVNLLRGKPIRVKIMGLREVEMRGSRPVTKKDIKNYASRLQERGLNVRVRDIIDFDIFGDAKGKTSGMAGCGSTYPFEW